MDVPLAPGDEKSHPSHRVRKPARITNCRIQDAGYRQFASGHWKSTTGTIKTKRISATSFVAPSKSPVPPPNIRGNQAVERGTNAVPWRRQHNAVLGPNGSVRETPAVTVATHRCF